MGEGEGKVAVAAAAAEKEEEERERLGSCCSPTPGEASLRGPGSLAFRVLLTLRISSPTFL